MPWSLFTTARRHWTWLRGAIEQHCQFSREARLETDCQGRLRLHSDNRPATEKWRRSTPFLSGLEIWRNLRYCSNVSVSPVSRRTDEEEACAHAPEQPPPP